MRSYDLVRAAVACMLVPKSTGEGTCREVGHENRRRRSRAAKRERRRGRADEGAVAGRGHTPRLDRTGRLQALRPADHLPSLPLAAVRAATRGAGAAHRRPEERLPRRRRRRARRPGRVPQRRRVHRPEGARWENIRQGAPRPTTSRCGWTMCSKLLETQVPGQVAGAAAAHLRRVEPRRARTSRRSSTCSRKDIFEAGPRRRRPDRPRLRVFHRRVRHRPRASAAASTSRRSSIVKTLVAMLEPERGRGVRPLLRLGRHVRAVGYLHQAQPPALFLRPGEQGLHVPSVPDEPVHPRPRRQHPARQLLFRRQARRR